MAFLDFSSRPILQSQTALIEISRRFLPTWDNSVLTWRFRKTDKNGKPDAKDSELGIKGVEILVRGRLEKNDRG